MKSPLVRYAIFAAGLVLAQLLPLQADLEKSPYNADVQVKTLLRTSTNSAGQPIEYPHEGTPEVSILIVTIAPGKQTGWHRHPVPLFGYVLSGQVTVHLAHGDKHTFRQGDALAEAVNLLHNGVNEGTVPTKLLIVVAGQKDVPFTVKAQEGRIKFPN